MARTVTRGRGSGGGGQTCGIDHRAVGQLSSLPPQCRPDDEPRDTRGRGDRAVIAWPAAADALCVYRPGRLADPRGTAPAAWSRGSAVAGGRAARRPYGALTAWARASLARADHRQLVAPPPTAPPPAFQAALVRLAPATSHSRRGHRLGQAAAAVGASTEGATNRKGMHASWGWGWRSARHAPPFLLLHRMGQAKASSIQCYAKRQSNRTRALARQEPTKRTWSLPAAIPDATRPQRGSPRARHAPSMTLPQGPRALYRARIDRHTPRRTWTRSMLPPHAAHCSVHSIIHPPAGAMTTGTLPPRCNRRRDTCMRWYSACV